ncbi:MAG TPA: thioredoxin family protein [Planctomicrobium sp.]|nr:thioredoxin family protein [Planctomicrobium sp.]
MPRTLIFIGVGIVLVLLVLNILPENSQSQANLERLSQIRPPHDWFQEQVINNPKTVLVDFTATWCGPCQFLNKTLAEIEKNYGSQLDIVKVDIDEHKDLAALYDVNAIPYVLIFRQGQVVAVIRGAAGYPEMESLVKPHLQPTVTMTQSETSSPH